jgi:hypothetical protein
MVEVGEVVIEKIIRPERRRRAEQHKDADEDITGRIGKVADEIPFEDRPKHVKVHSIRPCCGDVVRW